MRIFRHFLRFCVVTLFSVFGVNTAFAVPMTTSEFSFHLAKNTLLTQSQDVGFGARAPPTKVANVALTGDVTVMHGGAFFTHGVETRWASLNYGADLVATNNAGQLTRTYADGTFSVSDWAGYPTGVPKPPAGSTYRLLSGAEYQEARRLANNANARLRRSGVVPEGHEIHEIIPVKYGDSPTDPANKVYLPRGIHRSEVTLWWNRLQRDLEQ